MKDNAQVCYWCGQAATDDDHVPPRALFPDDNEYRKNLLKVPSCKEHNGMRSVDDQVASYAVLLHHGVNDLGAAHFSKAVRALEKDRKLAGRMVQWWRPAMFRGRETGLMQIDIGLLERFAEKIARGLYFHEFGKPWNIDVGCLAHGLVARNGGPSPSSETSNLLEGIFAESPRRGTNQMVFMYKWGRVNGSDDERAVVFRLQFYEGLVYYVLPDLHQRRAA